MKLLENERIEDLQCNGLKIIQNKTLYTFTSDSVVLANFVKTKKNDVAVEIGSGCGVISILVQAKNSLKKIYAFEIQSQMQDLCKKNVELNEIQEKIEVVCDNVLNFEKYIPRESVDVIFSNPPYFKTTNFKQSEVSKNAKEETLLKIDELVKVTSQMLKNGGTFFCCFSADRVCELVTLLQNSKLVVKEMFFTDNGKGTIKLVVLKAVKNAKNGCKIFKNLITNSENGDYIEQLHTKNFGK